jgi:hypothetical protein
MESNMTDNSILAVARAHFDNMRGQKIEIPEWGTEKGKPLVAFYDPPTLRVRQEIERRAGKSDARKIAVAAIICLKDKDGNPLFTDDAITLDALEGAVFADVAARIYTHVLGLTQAADLGN